MKRVATTTAAIFLLLTVSLAAYCDPSPIRLFVGKRPVLVTPSPVLDQNHVYVPLGALGYLGLSYAGAADGSQITVMTPGGTPKDVAVRNANGTKMVSLDELLEVSGGEVNLAADNRSATVRAAVKAIEFADNRLRIKCSVPVAPNVFRWDDKIVVDIPDAVFATEAKEVYIGTDSIAKARLGVPVDGTARIVLDTLRTLDFKPESPLVTAEVIVVVGDNLASLPKPDNPKPKPVIQPFDIKSIAVESVDEREFKLIIGTSSKGTAVSAASILPSELTLTLKGGTITDEVTKPTASHALLKEVRFAQASRDPAVTRVHLNLNRPVVSGIRITDEAITVSVRLPDKAGGTLAGKLVVLDPGHGGKAPGAQAGGAKEKGINLAMAQQVAAALREAGARVELTRESDQDIGLAPRPAVAVRAGADAFVSLHCNSNPKPDSVSGIETYHYLEGPSSAILAKYVQNAVCSATGMCDRHDKPENFAVLRNLNGSGIPGVLVECGYLNHSSDRKKLLDPEYRKKLAKGIVAGLKAYIEGTD